MKLQSRLCFRFLIAPLIAGCAAQALSVTPSTMRAASSVTTERIDTLGASRALLFVTNTDAVRAFHLQSNGNALPQRVIAGRDRSHEPNRDCRSTGSPIRYCEHRQPRPGSPCGDFRAQRSRKRSANKSHQLRRNDPPLGTAFDGAGSLYVANGDDGDNIAVFPPAANGCVANNRIIGGPHTTLSQPFGITLDPTGAIYVANATGGSVAVFASGAKGDATPRALIAGVQTRVRVPAGVALDTALNLYVTEFRANSVLEFPAAANGNVRPRRIISGAHTGLSGPNGIALDRAGNIYVANYFGNTITVYAKNSHGDASPIRKLAGANTGLSGPFKIAISQ